MRDICLTLVRCSQVDISPQLKLLRHKLFFNSDCVPNSISSPNLVWRDCSRQSRKIHKRSCALLRDTLVPGFSSVFSVCRFVLHTFVRDDWNEPRAGCLCLFYCLSAQQIFLRWCPALSNLCRPGHPAGVCVLILRFGREQEFFAVCFQVFEWNVKCILCVWGCWGVMFLY